MLAGLIVRFLFGVAGLWVAAQVLPGITYDSTGSLLAAALLLGLINAFVRPILVIFTLPLTVLTLGLFLLVINACTLKLVTVILHGFWTAFWAALIVSVAGWIASSLIKPQRRT